MINFGNFDFSDFDFSNVNPFPSTIDQVEEETTPTPAINIGEEYNNWFASTEEGQRSASVGPDLGNPFSLENLGITPEEAIANAERRQKESEEALALLTPEVRTLLEKSNFSGGIVPDRGGSMLSGGIFGQGGRSPYSLAGMAGGLARENQYNNITQYNPVGTAIGDMVVYDDLNSSEAKAAKAAREKEVTDSLQEWTQPLKELSKSDPARFTEEYSQLPTDARLAYLRNEYDQGSLTKREYQDAFAEQWNNSEKVEIGVLQHIEKYGYRMNSPDAIAQQGGQDQQGARDWYEADKVFGGDKGEAGDYSYLGSFTPTVKETFDPTSFGRGLLASAPLRLAAAVMTGGLSEGAIAAGKGVTGDTLHAGDWLSIASTGLQLADVITPPASEAAAAEAGQQAMQAADAAGLSNTAAMQAGNAAQATALAGKGLTIGNKALTYNQSVGLLNAAAGNPTGAALQLYGGDLINEGLDKVGLDQAAIERAGIQYDDFQAGMGKVVSEVAGGAELDNALASGLGTYIREGGTLGSIDLPETNIDLGVIEDVVRDVVRPIGKIGTEIAKFVEEVVPDVDTSALDPIEDAIREAGRTTEDVVRAGGRAVDEAVIQPTREVAKAFDDAVIQPVGDAFSALDTAVRQALPSTSLNVPNFDPSLGQFGLQFTQVSDTGEPTTQPSATRTTDALFGDELFKFKTPIEGTQERLDYIDLNSPFDQSQELELELTYPDSTEESDGFFEGTIYEQQPRSYNF